MCPIAEGDDPVVPSTPRVTMIVRVERRSARDRFTSLELVDLHLDALYQRDARGFVHASRDPGLRPPQFHFVRTPAGNRWLLAASLNPAQRERIASILSAEPLTSDCAAAETHPPQLAALRAAIRQQANPLPEYRGPAFFFPDQITDPTLAMLLVDLNQAPR